MESEVALDLGCERCARVYLAIWRNDGVSWMDKIMRDTRMSRKTAKRHLNRLLALRLVAEEILPVYKIVKEIEAVKKLKGGLENE